MNTFTSLLQKLYPQSYKEVSKKIEDIIEAFRQKHPELSEETQKTKPKSIFSERDAMLICYGDHVNEEKQPPLRSLDQFLRERAAGIFPRVHILPFYPYSSDDGFSVMDYYKVNPDYGSWDDVSVIGQNFDLMFDLVLNHVSSRGEWFRRFLAGDEKFKDFFIHSDGPVDPTGVFRPRTSELTTPFETTWGERYVWTTFSSDQVDLNFKNPEVLLETIRVFLYHIEHGARAVRLDAVAYVWKELGTSCFDLPEAHTIVRVFRAVIDRVAPQVWLVTETVLPHKQNISYFGDGKNEAHLAYNFPLETLLLYTVIAEDTKPITNWISTIDDAFGEETTLLNLSVSHDGIHAVPAKGILDDMEMSRVARQVDDRGGKVLHRTTEDGKQDVYEFNITYPSAFDSLEAFLASQLLCLALRGVPLIYFNTFFGMKNWTDGVEQLGYGRAINRKKYTKKELSAILDDGESPEYSIVSRYALILKKRSKESLFSPQAKQRAYLVLDGLFVLERFDNVRKLLVVVNVTNQDQRVSKEQIYAILGVGEVIDTLDYTPLKAKDADFILPAYGAWWLTTS